MGVTVKANPPQQYWIVVTEALGVDAIREFQRRLPPVNRPFGEYVINLKEIQHLDATGLSLLLQFRHRIQASGVTPTLLVEHPQLHEVLTSARFDRLFSINTI